MVEGRQLLIKTDHKPITFDFQQKADKASPRQLRQLDYIGQFSTNIIYVTGEENITADALSRISAITLPVAITTEELATAQRNDEELQHLLRSETTCDLKRIFEITHRLSHPSGRVTKKLICRKYVWPSMSKDILE